MEAASRRDRKPSPGAQSDLQLCLVESTYYFLKIAFNTVRQVTHLPFTTGPPMVLHLLRQVFNEPRLLFL